MKYLAIKNCNIVINFLKHRLYDFSGLLLFEYFNKLMFCISARAEHRVAGGRRPLPRWLKGIDCICCLLFKKDIELFFIKYCLFLIFFLEIFSYWYINQINSTNKNFLWISLFRILFVIYKYEIILFYIIIFLFSSPFSAKSL